MVTLTIDNQTVEVPEGSTVLQACDQLGIEIPVFCYHPKLSIAGNCRMCLVDVEKSPKPVASCAMPVAEGMVVSTHTDKVKRARQGVLELLLINHPLDCPICDQGGECDLQDLTMSYGRGCSRFSLNKRAVKDKYMGPLVKTVMTRCIHCTRCIRFTNEIAGTAELGTTGRGEHVEITSFLESAITSELSGNLVDICPVGALTNKPYAFHGRPWELSKTPSIDVMDALGAHIRIDTRGTWEVMRILPRGNDLINEDWITDRTRFAYDGLKYQRLDRPYVRKKGKVIPATFQEAFEVIASKIKNLAGTEIAAITGDLCDAESMYALKKLMLSLGSPHLESRQKGSTVRFDVREDYLFNTMIAGIEDSDVVLLIGTNPRMEATLINTRLRKRTLMSGGNNSVFSVGLIGPKVDLTYPYDHLGEKAIDLDFLSDGKHFFTQKLINAKNPVIVLGEAVLNHPDGEKILHRVRQFAVKNKLIREDWNPLNILTSQAATTAALDLDFLPQKGKDGGQNGLALEGIYQAVEKGDIKAVYLLGADDVNFERLKGAFIIYQGHHGEQGAQHADVILPGAAYTEKNGTYVNLEGRVQQGIQVVSPPGEAKEDWKIIRALSQQLKTPLPFDDLAALRAQMASEYTTFRIIGDIITRSYHPRVDEKLAQGKLTNRGFDLPISDFYLSNIITRHSKILAQCSRIRAQTETGERVFEEEPPLHAVGHNQ